jgi:hypothetical protein
MFLTIYHNDQIKEGIMGGTCNTKGDIRKECNILVGIPRGKRPLRRSRRRWKGDIKMNLEEIGCEDLN